MVSTATVHARPSLAVVVLITWRICLEDEQTKQANRRQKTNQVGTFHRFREMVRLVRVVHRNARRATVIAPKVNSSYKLDQSIFSC